MIGHHQSPWTCKLWFKWQCWILVRDFHFSSQHPPLGCLRVVSNDPMEDQIVLLVLLKIIPATVIHLCFIFCCDFLHFLLHLIEDVVHHLQSILGPASLCFYFQKFWFNDVSILLKIMCKIKIGRLKKGYEIEANPWKFKKFCKHRMAINSSLTVGDLNAII